MSLQTDAMDRSAQLKRLRTSYDALAPVWAQTTDDGLWNEVLDRRPIRSLLPPSLDGKAVLDVGCAAGAMAAELLRRGADVTGIDLSPGMVEAARLRCAGRGRFLVANLADPLPFPDAAFDGIVASLVLHYLRDWASPVTQLARILRPGGWLVFSTDHPDSPFSRANRGNYFATELLDDQWTKADVTIDVSFWRRPLSAIVDVLADAGFVLERILEPRATPQDRARFPDESAHLDDVPFRIVFGCRKPRAD